MPRGAQIRTNFSILGGASGNKSLPPKWAWAAELRKTEYSRDKWSHRWEAEGGRGADYWWSPVYKKHTCTQGWGLGVAETCWNIIWKKREHLFERLRTWNTYTMTANLKQALRDISDRLWPVKITLKYCFCELRTFAGLNLDRSKLSASALFTENHRSFTSNQQDVQQSANIMQAKILTWQMTF